MKNLQFEFEQTLLQSQLEIQEQTLKHISREIHDNIGQVLSLVSLNLNTLSLNDNDKLKFTGDLVTKAIDDLRGLSKSLSPDRVQTVGLKESINMELKHLERTGRFQTTLQIKKELSEISPERTIILYRMIQEVLNNIIKHSQATEVITIISGNNYQDIISIIDNGRGFDINESSTGLGLQNLKQRAGMIHSDIDISSELNKGTIVSFIIKNQ